MGVSTDSILFYGYDLGGENDGWKIQGVDEYESWTPSWAAADLDEDEEFDFEGDAGRRLLDSVGFTKEGLREDDYRGRNERLKVAKESLGVDIASHGADEYRLYYLYAYQLTASRGYPLEVDLQSLEVRRVAEGWDAKLATALRVLEIVPVQQEPRWVLASYWG